MPSYKPDSLITMKFPKSCFYGLKKLLFRKFRDSAESKLCTDIPVTPVSNPSAQLAEEQFRSIFHVEKSIRQFFAMAIRQAYPESPSPVKVLLAPGKVADFQINNSLSLAKSLNKPAAEVAAAILACIPANDIIGTSEADGRGFIYVNVRTEFLARYVCGTIAHGIAYPQEKKLNVVVDFSSPNIAKDMHVGHLRSTIIGDSLCRLYEFCGHNVHRVNHVGDWGTQFGMLIAYLKQQFPDCLENPPRIADLSVFYKASKVVFDTDAGFKERAYAEVVSLQRGDAEAVKAWDLLCNVSRTEFQVIYDRLQVKLDECGESFYKDKIPGTLELCDRAGLVTTLSDGAKVIMPMREVSPATLTEKEFTSLFMYAFREFKEETKLHSVLREFGIIDADDQLVQGKKPWKSIQEIEWQKDADKVAAAAAQMRRHSDWFANMQPLLEAKDLVVDESVKVPLFSYPLIVQKRDGGFTYDTTDLAAIWYRTQVLHADVVRVITDIGQAGHFELINSVADTMGWSSSADVGHIGFGLVTGLDGKRFRTRNTDVVKLVDLIDEAVRRCHEISVAKEALKEECQRLSEETLVRNAEVLGVAAIKYHDLKQNRSSSYAFSFDKMCDLDGNSALYLLYSYVRICGVVRKVSAQIATATVSPAAIEELCRAQPTARALALHIARFHAFVDRTLDDGMPSRLTDYAYALVCRFTDVYSKVAIKECPAAFALVNTCGVMLKTCMDLLGIQVVDRL